MIYLKGKDIKIIVFETGNLEHLVQGKPAHTPDWSVLIAWAPDIDWLADRIMDSEGDAAQIVDLIDEASKRPEKPSRPCRSRKLKFKK